MAKLKSGALIGCGFFAQNHMKAWAALDGVEITALCDLDADKAQAMAQAFGVSHVYTDTAQMYAAHRFDFVDVATTVDSHLPLVVQACANASTVICQKPFANTLQDAQAMVDAAGKNTAQLIIHENFRWQRPFMIMQQMIAEGAIGTPHLGQFSFRHGYDNYVNQPYLAEIDRFAIMDVGLHLFDLARFFMGEVTSISCSKQRLNPIVKGEDAFTALLKHQNGATCTVDCSFFSKYSPEPFPNTAALIEGDAGTLVLDRYNKLTHHTPQGTKVRDVDPIVPRWGAKPWHCVQDSVANFQTHALAVMNGQAPPQPSGADNLKTLALALAAYDAAEQDRTVVLTAEK